MATRRRRSDEDEDEAGGGPPSPKRRPKGRVRSPKGAGGAGGGRSPKAGGASPAATTPKSSGGSSVVEEVDMTPAIEAAEELGVDLDQWLAMDHKERAAVRLEAVRKMRKGKPVRLYADGIFDMFHYGHARALEQAKTSMPNAELLVGCCNDELTHRLKGRTVMKDTERYEALRHCRWVDHIIKDAPWVLTGEFLKEHDIDFVCHDALPYGDASGASSDIYLPMKLRGTFWETQRTEGVSTSDLIIRIVQDYDQFVRRNMKRGYSGKDMNVPFIKEKSIQLDLALEGAKKNVMDVIQHPDGVLTGLGEKVEEVQQDFVSLFSKDSKLRKQLSAVLSESLF